MTYSNRVSDESLYTILDTTEKFIYEKVRESVRESVTEKLLGELNELIQEAINSALSEIIFKISADRGVFNRTEDVRVLVEWLKCKEQKKKYVTRTIVEEDTIVVK
jgi:hypothetical protein